MLLHYPPSTKGNQDPFVAFTGGLRRPPAKIQDGFERNPSTPRIKKRSMRCSKEAHGSERVKATSFLQRVRQSRPVQVMPHLPGLPVALLEVAEVRGLHEEVVRRHSRDRVVQDAVQDPRASIRLAQALDQEIDLLGHAKLQLAEVHGLVVRRQEERRRRERVARSGALLNLILLQAEGSRVPHGRGGGEAPKPAAREDRPPEQRHRTATLSQN